MSSRRSAPHLRRRICSSRGVSVYPRDSSSLGSAGRRTAAIAQVAAAGNRRVCASNWVVLWGSSAVGTFLGTVLRFSRCRAVLP